jgi:hypothetical protein
VIFLGIYRNEKDVAMNAENPVQLDLFGVCATGPKTRDRPSISAVPAGTAGGRALMLS